MHPSPLPFTGIISTSVPHPTVLRWGERLDDGPRPEPLAPIPDGAFNDTTAMPAQGATAAEPTAPLLFDFAGLLNRSNISLRLNHQPPRHGVLTEVWADGANLRAKGMIDRYGGTIIGVVANTAAAGFPWRLSLNVSGNDIELVKVHEHESIQVNGLIHEGPLWVAKRFRLKEVSLCLDVVDRGAIFSVVSDGSIWPEFANIMTPNVPADAPAFVDDTGRSWRLQADYAVAQLLCCAVGVDLYEPDLPALINDRELFRDVVYILSVDSTGRRAPCFVETFDTTFQTPATRTQALGALIDIVRSYKQMIEAA